MRVLMLSLDKGLFGRGYSGDVLERHIKYAQGTGSLDIIVFAPKEFEDKAVAENLRIFSTKSGKSSYFRKALALAKRLARENQYDLLVTQEFTAPAGLKIKKLLNLPWIVNVHSMFFSSEWLKFNLLNWYLLYRIKKAVKFADGFRVNNKIIEAKLGDWGIKKPILVQPTPIDIEKFFKSRPLSNSPLARGEGFPSHFPPLERGGIKGEAEGLKVLFVGRLSPEKNVAMLIRAVRIVFARTPHLMRGTKQSHGIAALPSVARNDVELQIVGIGTEEDRLKKLAGDDRRIKFLGPKTYEELPPIFQAADIFVLPSNTESFGQVLWQAAAAGCAIVATRTTGAQGIIEHGKTGILIEVGDEHALMKNIQSLIQDTSLRKALGDRAYEMAESYDSDKAVLRTIEFWRKVAGK